MIAVGIITFSVALSLSLGFGLAPVVLGLLRLLDSRIRIAPARQAVGAKESSTLIATFELTSQPLAIYPVAPTLALAVALTFCVVAIQVQSTPISVSTNG